MFVRPVFYNHPNVIPVPACHPIDGNSGGYRYRIPFTSHIVGFQQHGVFLNSIQPILIQPHQPFFPLPLSNLNTYDNAHRTYWNQLRSGLNPQAKEFFPTDIIQFNKCRCNHINPIKFFNSNLNPNAYSFYPQDILAIKIHNCRNQQYNLQRNVVENTESVLSQHYYKSQIFNQLHEENNENLSTYDSLDSPYDDDTISDQEYEDLTNPLDQDWDFVNSMKQCKSEDLDLEYSTYPTEYELDFLKAMRQYENECLNNIHKKK